MRSGYSTKEIKDVINTLREMGINAKQAGVSKSGSLKMKEKKNIYTFSRVGDEIVSLNLDDFPPVKPFNEEDALENIQKQLTGEAPYDINVAECSENAVVASVSCHGICFEHRKPLSCYEKENLTYAEITDNLVTEIENRIKMMFCETKSESIEDEVINEIRKLGYGKIIDSRNRYSKVIGDEFGRMFRFSEKRPSVTNDGFEIEGSGFSIRYRDIKSNRPEIYNTDYLEKAKETAKEIDKNFWKFEYINNILKHISEKENISATCLSKITAPEIKSADTAEFKLQYIMHEYVFSDTCSIALEKDKYDEMVSNIDDICEKFTKECNKIIQKDKDEKTKELEDAGLCYKILPYAIYKVVEGNNDAVTENMTYNNLYGQKRSRKTNIIEGYSGKFRNIDENNVVEAIRDMKDAGVLREAYHINEFNNRFYFLMLGEEYRDCLPSESNKTIKEIMSQGTDEWTDFDWIKVLQNIDTTQYNIKQWLQLIEVFRNENVCMFCEEDLLKLFSSAPEAIIKYLDSADVGHCYSYIKDKVHILQTKPNVV